MKNKITAIAIFSLAVALFAISISADNPPSQYNIDGFIKDAGGKGVPVGTSISLFNANTSNNQSTTTINSRGRYSIILDGANGQHIKITPFNNTHIGRRTVILPQAAGGITVIENVNISLNNHPSLGDVQLNDTSVAAGVDVRATTEYLDQENDTASIQFIWLINGNAVFNETFSNKVNANVSSTLSSSLFKRGDTIKARVNSTDTFYPQGPKDSAEIIIENTAPVASSPAISPSEPTVLNNITAIYGYQDADGDIETKSLIRWFKNGVEEKKLENSSTVNSSDLVEEDKWMFKITPSDGTDFGNTPSSANVTIRLTSSISLLTGFNLFAIPVNLSNYAVDDNNLIVSKQGCVNFLYRFNTSTGNYEIAVRSDQDGWASNDGFLSLEPGRGYWAKANQSCNLRFNGRKAAPFSVNVVQGFNLLGWFFNQGVNLDPDPFSTSVANCLQSFYYYDAAAGRYKVAVFDEGFGWASADDVASIDPGKGFWLRAERACRWDQQD